MDYKKKYKEALKRARKAYNSISPENHDARRIIEDAFPELAESEDERIRKGLLRHFKNKTKPYWNEIAVKDIIAYLEKQKEHHIPWYDYQKSKEAGYTIVPNEEYEQLIKQKEQKPAEWSEDFDKEVENIHKRYPEVSFAKLTRIAYHFSKWANSYKGMEWSEEDEKIYTFVYDFFENCWWNTNWEISREQALKMLKSLKPHWKPSEDEERLINTSISFLKDFADKGYENAVECIDWLKSKLNGNTCK